MITIKKGSFEITCSKGTYENNYKFQGYQIVQEKKGTVEKQSPLNLDDEKKDEKTIDDLKEDYEKVNEKEYGIEENNNKKTKSK